jgi:hypothetical protein
LQIMMHVYGSIKSVTSRFLSSCNDICSFSLHISKHAYF